MGSRPKEYKRDKQFLRRRKLEFLSIVNRMFSLPIKLGVTENKQVTQHQGQNARRVKCRYERKYMGSGMEYPYNKVDSNSSALEFCRELNPNQ